MHCVSDEPLHVKHDEWHDAQLEEKDEKNQIELVRNKLNCGFYCKTSEIYEDVCMVRESNIQRMLGYCRIVSKPFLFFFGE